MRSDVMQPIIFDVDSQDDALSDMHEDCNEEKKDEIVKKREIDANDLVDAKSKLVKYNSQVPVENDDADDDKIQDDAKPEDKGLQDLIVDAVSKIRQYHTDSEDDESESDSLYGSP